MNASKVVVDDYSNSAKNFMSVQERQQRSEEEHRGTHSIRLTPNKQVEIQRGEPGHVNDTPAFMR